jgi:hypothetical protein
VYFTFPVDLSSNTNVLRKFNFPNFPTCMSRMFVIDSLLERVWKENYVKRYQLLERSETPHIGLHESGTLGIRTTQMWRFGTTSGRKSIADLLRIVHDFLLLVNLWLVCKISPICLTITSAYLITRTKQSYITTLIFQ